MLLIIVLVLFINIINSYNTHNNGIIKRYLHLSRSITSKKLSSSKSLSLSKTILLLS